MRILVVDDEQDICEILQYNLETEGYEVTTANSAEEALMHLKTAETDNRERLPNLILLDVMMGEMSGFQMARLLKENPLTADIPIIFITALDGEDNTVKGLNIGADDYIAKPLSLREVKARIKAVLRRTQPHLDKQQIDIKENKQQSNIIAYSWKHGTSTSNTDEEDEMLLINQDSKLVTVDGTETALTKIEFELLSLLVKHVGKVFSREELLDRCWPSDTIVLDRTVDVNITRLRKKIGRYGALVKTRFGYGYTFEK